MYNILPPSEGWTPPTEEEIEQQKLWEAEQRRKKLGVSQIATGEGVYHGDIEDVDGETKYLPPKSERPAHFERQRREAEHQAIWTLIDLALDIIYVATLGVSTLPRRAASAGVRRLGRRILERKLAREAAEEIAERAARKGLKELAKEGLEEAVEKGAKKTARSMHHYATNKHLTHYTKLFERIAKKYGLDLDDPWNKEILPHGPGRHPHAYHEFVLEQMRRASREAGTDVDKFLKLFEKNVKKPVRRNPDMVRKRFWE